MFEGNSSILRGSNRDWIINSGFASSSGTIELAGYARIESARCFAE